MNRPDEGTVGLSWKSEGLRVLALFLALALARFEIVRELELDAGTAYQLGVGRGLLYDAILALLPSLAVRFFWAWTGRLSLLLWSIAALLAWFPSAANAIYFRYFGERLDFWVVQHHIPDLIAVRGSLGPLVTAPVALSLALLVVFLVFLLRRQSPSVARVSPVLRRAEIWGLAAITLAASFSALSLTTYHPRLGTVLDDQILFVWVKTGFGTRRITYRHEVVPEIGTMIADLSHDPVADRALLVRFRDLASRPDESRGALERILQPQPERTASVRRRLGLPADRAPNVILLFLESVRDFEMQHPELGPLLFPEYRKVLAEHGIHFRQAYSSAIGAGLTARGQFSTLCSLLPNMRGAATFITHYRLRSHCLQALARDNGYRTQWISSQDITFQGKEIFESLHGTQEVLDQAYWKTQGLQKNFDNCGVADEPFLQSYLTLLEEKRGEDERPFLVNTLTISTHTPHTELPGVTLPGDLGRQVDDPGYRGYLTRLHYLDGALGKFFRAFFASPLSEDTVVVVLGDHSMKVEPHLPLAPHQRVEMLARIPLAIISRDLDPEVIDHPVHQVDVAPTVAEIAGLSGPTNWLGRSLLGTAGTPWVMSVSGAGLQYRHGDHACYSAVESEARSCHSLAGVDPLFATELEIATENADQAGFFARVVEANSRAIMLDRLLEPASGTTLAGRQAGR